MMTTLNSFNVFVFLSILSIGLLITANLSLAQSNDQKEELDSEAGEQVLFLPDPFVHFSQSDKSQDVKQIDVQLHTDEFIASWTANAVQKIMTLNSITDFDLHMDSLSAFFTPQGLKEFRESFEYSGIRNSVKVNDFHMGANLLKPPSVQGSGVMESGFYQWTVSLPIEVKFIRDLRFRDGEQGRQKAPPVQTSSQNWNLIILIVRSNDPLNPYGIGIQKWITE